MPSYGGVNNIALILKKNSQTTFNSRLTAVRSETSSPKFVYNHQCFDILAKNFVARGCQMHVALMTHTSLPCSYGLKIMFDAVPQSNIIIGNFIIMMLSIVPSA